MDDRVVLLDQDQIDEITLLFSNTVKAQEHLEAARLALTEAHNAVREKLGAIAESRGLHGTVRLDESGRYLIVGCGHGYSVYVEPKK